MKVLILGSGGREHALACAVSHSQRVTRCRARRATAALHRWPAAFLWTLNMWAMVRLAEVEQPSLTIVGPELPLSLGVVDAFRERGYRIFGPTRDAARLESSKAFAKQFMKRHQIPTAQLRRSATTGQGSGRGSTSISIRRWW